MILYYLLYITNIIQRVKKGSAGEEGGEAITTRFFKVSRQNQVLHGSF